MKNHIHLWQTITDRSHQQFVLRKLLGQFLETDGDRLSITRSTNGRPILNDFPRVQFSISHTEQLFILGIALDQPIGVDCEAIRNRKNYTAIAKRFFDENENAYIQSAAPDQQSESFLKVWTQKEAALKASGFGLAQADKPLNPELNTHNFTPLDGYIAAISSIGHYQPSVRWVHWLGAASPTTGKSLVSSR